LALSDPILQAAPHFVQLKIAERGVRHVALAGEQQARHLVLCDMAEVAADIIEGPLPARR
jgi:hypothetical protein